MDIKDININYNFDEMVNKFPILNSLKGVLQSPVYHGEGDVFIHSKKVCEELVKLNEFTELNEYEKKILFLGAVFHDIGKAVTTKIEDGKIKSPHHGSVGAKIFREYFYKEFQLSFIEREKIASLIKYHGVPLFFFEKNDVDKLIIKTSLNTNLKLLYILAKADLYGRICNDSEKLEESLELFVLSSKELNCFNKPFQFKNELTKQVYLNGGKIWHSDELYDKNTFKVILLSGIPYSGKDTYIQENFNSINTISLDDIRREIKIPQNDSSLKEVHIAKERAREFLRKKETFIWNATNTRRQIRESLINMFSSYGGITEIHYLEAPYGEILNRMEVRSELVPLNAINKIIKNMDMVERSEGEVTYKVYNNS